MTRGGGGRPAAAAASASRRHDSLCNLSCSRCSRLGDERASERAKRCAFRVASQKGDNCREEMHGIAWYNSIAFFEARLSGLMEEKKNCLRSTDFVRGGGGELKFFGVCV